MSATETVIDAGTGELVAYAPGPVAYRQPVAELAAQADEIRAMVAAVLKEGTDYGTIPGTQKPTLLKSGAEWLLKWAGYGHRLEPVEIERDDIGRKYGVTYRCTVTVLGQPDAIVSTCDGYAGYDEDRFYQSVAELQARERFNAARYERRVNPQKWAEPYRAPWNSVLKMAEKRALVGAALQATATSGLFTQDMEDVTPPPPAPAATTGAVAEMIERIQLELGDDERVALRSWMASRNISLLRSPVIQTDLATVAERIDHLIVTRLHDDDPEATEGGATRYDPDDGGGS